MSENNVNALSFEFDRSNMFEPLLQADPSFVKSGRHSRRNIDLTTSCHFTWHYQSLLVI